MEGLVGYMARIVGWVVVCESARKKTAGSETTQDTKVRYGQTSAQRPMAPA